MSVTLLAPIVALVLDQTTVCVKSRTAGLRVPIMTQKTYTGMSLVCNQSVDI